MNTKMKIMLRYIIILLLIFSNTSILTAQRIRGTVFELHDHGPHELPGANIHWLGTSTGTASDEDGRFSIPTVTDSHVLIVSFIGYKPDTLHVHGDDNDLEIILKENRELEEVTVAGRSAGSHMSRVNPITTVQITGEELCRAACCNLSESFETNASVDVTYNDAATGARQIRLLGLSGQYLQMLTETMPNFRGLGAAFGLDYVPGTWMESIQISKGTASVVNGYEALTGQINVEYKKPIDEDKLFLNGFANSQGRFETNANTRIHLGERWKTAILAHASSDAMENDENNDGFLDEPMTKKYSFMNRWEYNNFHNINSQFGIKVVQEERTGGQTAFDRDIAPQNQSAYGIIIDTKRIEGFFKTGLLFPDDEHTNLSLVSNIVYHDQKSVYGQRVYNADQTSFRTNLMFQSHFGDNEKHSYTTGATYALDRLSEDISGPEITYANPGIEEHASGLFFQYAFSIPELITILAGFRADHSSIFDYFYTPRFHLKYQIDDVTTLRASAGAGYRTPFVMAENNSILASSRHFIADEELRQEKGWNYGANIARYFYPANKEVAFNVEFYRTDFENRLIRDLDQSARAVHFYNLKGKSYSNTFQTSISSEVLSGLDLLLAYRLNDTKINTNGQLQEKALQSRHKGLFNLSWATWQNKWQVDFTTQLNGPGRIPSTLENPAGLQRSTEYDSYTIMNAQLTHNVKNWSFYGGVENLTDFVQENPIIDAESPFSNYFDSSLVWGPIVGRRFYFGVRFSI